MILARITSSCLVLAPLLLLTASRVAAADAGSTVDDPHAESVKKIFAWVHEAPDGFVTPKQGVSRMVEGNTDTPLIIVALEDIAKGELLVQTPWSHIIHSKTLASDDALGWYCGTTRSLAEEMRKGADSFYAPYAMYLNEEPDNQLTHQYSPNAKKMLHQVIGTHPDEVNRSPMFDRKDTMEQRLMPEGIDASLDVNWFGICGADPSDKIATKAASMVIQRADDYILIPAYDAYNHRNNDKHNGKEYMNARTLTTMDKYHQTFALRDIKKGEQIFISYNMCEQCGGRIDGEFGTAEMYREYGFVEWFPQRWWYPGFGDYHEDDNPQETAQFDLYQEEVTGNLTVVWTHLSTDAQKLARFEVFLQREIRRLNRLKNIEWSDMYNDWTEDQWKESGITSYEWSNINLFVDANIVAMTVALEDLRTNSGPVANDDDDDGVDKEPSREPLTISPEALKVLERNGSHYDLLEQPEKDDLAYYRYTCDNSADFEFMGYVDTEVEIETDAGQFVNFCESFYFNTDPEAVDVCMDVDDVVQICSSYRPQQHEYMIHAAAKYLPKVKRVAFVGGGNSMLLHEILKYPEEDLELVVGLELDQTITRKSFKHFHTDPHFDDPRVEWWFGDVAKSLMVLPESYWGSFDLVLVELSEKMLARNVSTSEGGEGVDLLSALSLLLNPKTGIIAKQELYVDKLSQVFDYAIELEFESPVICSQTLALGSNGIDFFHAPVYDHGVAVNDQSIAAMDKAHRYDLMHDFRTLPEKSCGEEERTKKTESEDEENEMPSFGVLEVVTLEQVKKPFDSFQIVVPDGFHVVEHTTQNKEDPTMLTVTVLEEGYVAARVQRSDEGDFSLGFDIHLWSQTHRIEEFRKALRDAYGAEVISSYKIVAGGMFGSRDETKRAGLPVPLKASDRCENDGGAANEESNSNPLDDVLVNTIAVQEAVSLVGKGDVVAAVFCGGTSEPCTSYDALSGHKSVKEAIPLYACSSTAGGNDVTELYACERKIIEELMSKLGFTSKLDMFVIDGNSSHEMYQIVNSIFDTHNHREFLLNNHSIAVTWSPGASSKKDPWARELLDRYRKQIHNDPVKLGEFEIRLGAKKFELGVVSTNDPQMNYGFADLEKQIQARLAAEQSGSGIVVELRKIHGGLYNYMEQYAPKRFSQKDYDNTLAKEHFSAQVPLGRQTIFQYELDPELKKQNFFNDDDLGLSIRYLEKVLYGSLAATPGLFDLKVTTFASVKKHQIPVGDGCVFLLFGDNFNLVSVWDGREHLDINFFAFGILLSAPEVKNKINSMINEVSPLKAVAIDTQPRGIGRVVNFPEDLETLSKSVLYEYQYDDDENHSQGEL